MGGGKFLLTRPLRDVTSDRFKSFMVDWISTHTPLAGRDVAAFIPFEVIFPFLLTRPLRDVTTGRKSGGDCERISTHTPLAGRDRHPEPVIPGRKDFYSHAPCGT